MTPDKVAQLFGRPIARVDGIAKVTGAARFASDEPVAHPVYAYLVTSSIARGRISRFQLEDAKSVKGVIEIFTHENIGTAAKSDTGPDGHPSTTTLESNQVWYDGQIVASRPERQQIRSRSSMNPRRRARHSIPRA